MDIEKRKKAGIKRGKKRKKSDLLPLTNATIDFDSRISAIDKAINLLYRRM
jgi:hypothetical protein